MSSKLKIQARLERAVTLHQQGHLQEAQVLYEGILKKEPNHVDVLHLLGAVAVQTGSHQRAVALYDRAIRIDPRNALFHYNRGFALQELKQLEAAIASYDRAVALQPDYAKAFLNRGAALQAIGRLEDAVASYDKAIALQPGYAEAWVNRGNALKDLSQPTAAVASYDKAIALRPGDAEAHSNRGTVMQELGQLDAAVASYDKAIAIQPGYAKAYSNRGVALKELGQLEAAVASFNKAIALQPDYAEAYYNMGNALKALKQLEAAVASYGKAIGLQPAYAEAYANGGAALQALQQLEAAVASYDKSIALQPDNAEAWSNRGVALHALRRLDEAVASYDKAIALQPDYAEAWSNRGNALKELRRLDEAVASFDKAIALQPDFVNAHWNKSLVLLAREEFAAGWDLYDWRWQREESVPDRKHIARDWDGAKVDGSLLVLSEQGVGDVIFYSGMLNELRGHADSITVGVDTRLVAIYERSFEHVKVVPKTALPPEGTIDAQVYLPSLGRFFRAGNQAFENVTVPYLRACPERTGQLRAQLKREGRLLCGLSWVSKNADIGEDKTMTLLGMRQILGQENVDFVDLQYGDTSEEQKALFDATGIRLRQADGVDTFNDLDGLAAVMAACDLVITVSNTTAHLAGALGRPLWIMLPYSTGLHWYWHLDRSDSPWYPTARLYRQQNRGDWSAVIEHVAADLKTFA